MTDQDNQNKTAAEPQEKKTAEEPTKVAEKGENEVKKTTKSLSKNVEKIIEEIEKLSVLELADLVKALEKKFGVSSQTMVAPTGQVPGGQQPQEEKAEESQTVFNVILASTGANKIGVIKTIRELVPTLGLKEAKDLVEAAPKEVMSQVNKATAEEAKKKLEAAGATVELK